MKKKLRFERIVQMIKSSVEVGNTVQEIRAYKYLGHCPSSSTLFSSLPSFKIPFAPCVAVLTGSMSYSSSFSTHFRCLLFLCPFFFSRMHLGSSNSDEAFKWMLNALHAYAPYMLMNTVLVDTLHCVGWMDVVRCLLFDAAEQVNETIVRHSVVFKI